MQLKIEHLSFTYDGAPEAVFADLSLSLDTAWRTGLIARNGRGKTTLLRQKSTSLLLYHRFSTLTSAPKNGILINSNARRRLIRICVCDFCTC